MWHLSRTVGLISAGSSTTLHLSLRSYSHCSLLGSSKLFYLLFYLYWRSRSPNGSVMKTVKMRYPRNCIGVRTRISILYIELIWDTSKDLNLRVIQSSHIQINRSHPRSPSGGVLKAQDFGSSGCVRFFAEDRVSYWLGVAPSGSYIVLIENVYESSTVTVCNLRVTFRGKVITDISGSVSTIGPGVDIRSFEIPYIARTTYVLLDSRAIKRPSSTLLKIPFFCNLTTSSITHSEKDTIVSLHSIESYPTLPVNQTLQKIA